MTKVRVILATGLLLAASAVFAQTPTVEVKGVAAAKDVTNAVKIIIHPNGAKVAGITLEMQFPAEAAANIALGTTTGSAPTGWDPPAVTNPSAGRIVFLTATTTGMGQDTDPLVFNLNLTNKIAAAGLKGTKINVVGYDPNAFTGSNIALEDLSTIGVPAAAFAVVNGASRDLGGAMNNAVSVAPGLIAAAAGTTLWLLNPATPDLAPVTNWASGQALAGTVQGRPAFGAIGGALSVAVGTDTGTVSVFDVAAGTKVDYKGDFTSATTPAIGPKDNVYVAGKTATGVQVARIKLAGNSVTLGEAFSVGTAADVQSSPAVSGNRVVVGTNNTVFYATTNGDGVMTPQSVTGIATDDFNTSPVISGASAFIGGASGKVYRIALAGGTLDGTSTALTAPLSDPFAMNGKVEFGAGDGKLYTFAGGDLTASPTSVTIGDGPVVSPVDTGSLLVAATKNGVVSIVGTADSVDLGPTLGKAVALLPGTTPMIVINKVDGTVYALPTK